jgi:hypothetical protein
VPWQGIRDVGTQSGVYSWYFTPRFADRDLKELESTLESGGGTEAVESFLQKQLFGRLREDPYHAEISGQLKAKYSGQLDHVASITPGLLERLAAEPKRCRELGEVLTQIAPYFSSPLYIGMAKNLSSRLNTHKRLITAFHDGASPPPPTGDNDELRRDYSFAKSVYLRNLPVAQLFVQILPVMNPDLKVDVENVLNRISFPIFGRN